jgi:sugar/nucleoside kinase (ribokinase family)
VDLSDVQVDERLATGLCFAAISPGGERTFFSFRGANVAMGLPEGRDALAGVRWLHICGHALLEGAQRETGLSLIDAAYQRGLPVSLDLCLPLISARRAEVLDLLPSIATLFVNELEYAALLGGALPPEGVLLVVKLGARGCALGRELRPVPGYAVRALDTTACGDAFAAGFVHAHLRGATPPACAALGNALGALVATRPGAADSLPGREELLAFLTERAPELSRLVG